MNGVAGRMTAVSPMPPATAESDIDLRAKVDFLCRPESYPERPVRVDAKETHMSWVFLTDRHAYKLKKPVRHSFLDFSTIELRRTDCEEEVRLNCRLAPDVYLGVVPLGLDRSGRLCLGGQRPVDWLVKMRRLPAACALDYAIHTNAVAEADIRRLAARLAEFYRRAPRIDVTAEHYRAELEDDVGLTERTLSRPHYSLPVPMIRPIATTLRNYLSQHKDALDQRVGERQIVEGHGDLRPEHIYLEADPVVIDCLEFNFAFRIIDPADELAYLAMECEREGAPSIGVWLFEAYGAARGDRPGADLIAFYKCRRAFLRARIAIAHLDESHIREPGKWHERTASYLKLARSYLRLLA